MKTLIASILSFSLPTYLYIHNPKIMTEIKIHETVKEADIPTLDEAIGEAAQRHSIPLTLLRAIARIESGEDKTNSAVRREAHLVESQGEVNSHSYGVMQLMAFHAVKTCHVASWAELVGIKNISNNVDCGAQILKTCLDNAKANTKYQKYRKALSCYNGDATGRYADKVLLAYSEISLS